MSYSRIEDFPPYTDALGSNELRALRDVWKEKKDEMEGSGAYQEFIKKLQREWAIETGIIERLYTWDRGVTEVLIEQGIDSNVISIRGVMQRDEAEHVKLVIEDHLSIVDGLFSYIKNEQPLTEHFIRGMQAQFTANQHYSEALTSDGRRVQVSLEKGSYKTQPNNPRRPDGEMHEYCPPELTQEEMSRLVEWYRISEDVYPAEVRAAWLHHRFTQIHPFQDGNGRVARALATLVFIKDGLFPLVVRDSDRREYIDALESADSGSLKPLVDLFVKRQRDAILNALGLEQQVQQGNYADQIISSALEVLKSKYEAKSRELTKVYDYATELFSITESRLNEIAKSISPQLASLTPLGQSPYGAWTNRANDDSTKKHYFYKQIVDIAKKFNYYSNLDRYRAWVQLSLHTDEDFEYVVSIHGHGHGDNGIMAVSALTFKKIQREGGGTEPINLLPATTDLFQFNYAEPLESTKKRYTDWLESSLAMALAEWKRQLSV